MAFPGFDSPAYGTIGGNLPWGNAGAGAVAGAASGNPQAIAGAYGANFNNALAMNQGNYQNVMAGYKQTMASQTSAQQAIQAGYSNLYNDVLTKIQGIGQGRSDAINRASEQTLARSSQQLIDRGLGNSTVQSSLNRGVESDRNARQLELSDSLAQQMGGFMSNLGLAGLQSQQRGADNSTALAGRQLDFMNSVSAKYPDAGMYASLAQQAAQAQAGKNQPFSYGGGSFAGGPGPKLGYVPAGGPYYGGSFGGDIAGGGGMGGGMGSWAGSPTTAGGYGTPTGGGGGMSDYAGMGMGAAMGGAAGGGYPDYAAMGAGAAAGGVQGGGEDWASAFNPYA